MINDGFCSFAETLADRLIAPFMLEPDRSISKNRRLPLSLARDAPPRFVEQSGKLYASPPNLRLPCLIQKLQIQDVRIDRFPVLPSSLNVSTVNFHRNPSDGKQLSGTLKKDFPV